MYTCHPSHGEDHDPIGVQNDQADESPGNRWSWKCWCGAWEDGYPYRREAREAYKRHKKGNSHYPPCEWAAKRKPQRADYS